MSGSAPEPSSGPSPGATSVSIIITNHNYGRYLGACVESALAQTHRPLEVVVVDDGSTDDSRAVLAGFGDRVRAVLTPNGGQAAAINAGFAAGRGDLVLFLDSDDVLEPWAAASLAAAWRPGVARVQGRTVLMDADGARRGGLLPADPLPRGDVRHRVLEAGGYPSTGTTGAAYGRACLERILPIPEAEWRRAPDVYLLLLAPFLGPVESVERPVGAIRVHGANSWSAERPTADRLAEHLAMDLHKERLLRDRATALGTAPPDDWLLRSAAHLQSRLALLRLDPAAHPFPGDRALRLGRLGVAAALRNPGFSLRKRLLLAGWFILGASLPRRAAAGVLGAGLVRTGRPAWLQRFIERGARA